MKKNRSVQSNQDYPSAFSHAWQNEINRCMFGNLLTPFEYGNEFGSELIFNDLSMTSDEEKKNSKKKKTVKEIPLQFLFLKTK